MSAMWKKWFWATAASGVELCALRDCGLGCLVADSGTRSRREDGVLPGNSCSSAKLDYLWRRRPSLVTVRTGWHQDSGVDFFSLVHGSSGMEELRSSFH